MPRVHFPFSFPRLSAATRLASPTTNRTSRPREIAAAAFILLALSAVACGGGDAGEPTAEPDAATEAPPPTVAPTAEPAIALVLVAGDQRIETGACTTLQWEVANAQAVYLDGAGVPATDTREVCPSETTTYELSAVNTAGEEHTRSVVVEVQAPAETATPIPPPPATRVPATAVPVVTAAPTPAPTEAISIAFYGLHGDKIPEDQLCTEVVWETRGVTEVHIQVGDGGREAVGASGRKTDLCFPGEKLMVRLYFKNSAGAEESRELTITRED
jgi:hypothetical protein